MKLIRSITLNMILNCLKNNLNKLKLKLWIKLLKYIRKENTIHKMMMKLKRMKCLH